MERNVTIKYSSFLKSWIQIKSEICKNDYFEEARSSDLLSKSGSWGSTAADFLDTFGTKTASMTCMIPLEVFMSALMTLAWLTCNTLDLSTHKPNLSCSYRGFNLPMIKGSHLHSFIIFWGRIALMWILKNLINFCIWCLLINLFESYISTFNPPCLVMQLPSYDSKTLLVLLEMLLFQTDASKNI